MCYYSSQVESKKTYMELEYEFTLKYGHEEYENDYLISGFEAPEVPIITADGEFKKYRWGLMPSWCKDLATAVKLSRQTLNAVGETIDKKPAFRGAVKNGRFCLVPMSGFFDFHHLGKESYPFYIHPKMADYFIFGGLYEHWNNPANNERFDTFSIVTTEANARMAWIHNLKKRMPLILSKSHSHLWIDKDISFEEKKKLIVPYDEELMADYPVRKFLKWDRSKKESPEVLVKTEYPELLLAS